MRTLYRASRATFSPSKATVNTSRCLNRFLIAIIPPKSHAIAADNNRDAKSKDRNAKGSRHGHAVVNEADVVEICQLRINGWSCKQICESFSIGRAAALGLLLTGETWRHVPRPIIRTVRRGRLPAEVIVIPLPNSLSPSLS